MAVAMVFASCSKDDNDPIVPTQQEIEAKIVAKWKMTHFEGKECTTNEKKVLTYFGAGKMMYSKSDINAYHGEIWYNKINQNYSVEDNNILMFMGEKPSAFVITMAVDKIGEKELSTTVMNSFAPTGKSEERYLKISADYSQDIIGMWEGVDMTGYETYGDAHHRIEYRADGTYTYYSWDETTQTWQPLEDVFDEWNVDGDWLATRWQNNGSDVMNYEWWDIDYIKKEGNDIIMKWSALREKEDGERFTTTFTWKKVK